MATQEEIDYPQDIEGYYDPAEAQAAGIEQAVFDKEEAEFIGQATLSESGVVVDFEDFKHARKGDQADVAVTTGTSDSEYLARIANHRLLGAQEEIDLAKRIERGDLEAKDMLATSNMKLVISVAKGYAGKTTSMSLIDLVQEGTTGLIRATEKFDWRRGYKFSTYATWWIRQSIIRAMADKDRTVRLPVHVHEHVNKIARAERIYEQLNGGQSPTPEDISAITGQPPELVARLQEAYRITSPLSLDRSVNDETDDTYIEFTASDELTPEETAIDNSELSYIKELAEQLLNELPEREATVLRMRYGFDAGRKYTLEQIGMELDVTRERARQLIVKAEKDLETIVRSRQLSLEP